PAELAADAGRAEAVLDAAADLALQPDEEDGAGGDEGDEDQRRDDRRQSAGPAGGQPEPLEQRRQAKRFFHDRSSRGHVRHAPEGAWEVLRVGVTVWGGQRGGKVTHGGTMRTHPLRPGPAVLLARSLRPRDRRPAAALRDWADAERPLTGELVR